MPSLPATRVARTPGTPSTSATRSSSSGCSRRGSSTRAPCASSAAGSSSSRRCSSPSSTSSRGGAARPPACASRATPTWSCPGTASSTRPSSSGSATCRSAPTRRGIGPAYADKAARVGIRVQDLLDEKILRQKIATALELKNEQLQRLYELEPLDGAELADDAERYAERLRPYIADTSLILAEHLDRGDDVLCEGAQATLLDLDHGTYPFVTSSNPTAGGAAVGLGFGPTQIERVIGIAKAYLTRVGAGPFPSEAPDEDNERLRQLGGEFGTVTGRARRCGWLDLVALRYAVRVNGFTELVLTKLDVLSGFDEIPVCVGYRLADGSETPHFPAHQSDFHHAEPLFQSLPGWHEPIDGITAYEELPRAAREYVEFVERSLDVPVSMVGVGQRRDQILSRGAAIARS